MPDLTALTRVLVISPHLDDAALSAWSVLGGRAHCPADVMTVFAGLPAEGVSTDPDRTCGFSTGIEAIQARRREDEEALAGLATRNWWLPLLDRMYVPGGRRTASESETIVREAEGWLRDHGSPGAQLAIAIPAGAGVHVASASERGGDHPRGGRYLAWARALKHRVYVRRRKAALAGRGPAHPDHIFVRDAILDALDRLSSAQILCYEELPYLWSQRAESEMALLAASRGMTADGFDLAVDRVDKHRHLLAYKSQLAALDPEGRLLDSTLLPAEERYWTLSTSGR